MIEHLARLAEMIGQFLSQRGIRLGLLLALALVAYGVVPETSLAWLVLLFASARCAFVGREALRRPPTEADWQVAVERRTSELETESPDEHVGKAARLGLPEAASVEEIARTEIELERAAYVPPRSHRELAFELLGLSGYVILLPAAVLLQTRDFVSSRPEQGWLMPLLAAACVALYAVPFIWMRSGDATDRRSIWWVAPFFPALLAVIHGVGVRHPYLDPLREDHERLAAEKVLSLTNNVTAGIHADWVFRYAAMVEDEGRAEEAAELYRRGLRLAPRSGDAHARLEALERRLGSDHSVAKGDTPATTHEGTWQPYWEAGAPAPVPRTCAIDVSLTSVPRTTVVVVPFEGVSGSVVAAVVDVIERELGLPACLAEATISLPPPSRTRGVVFGSQWDTATLAEQFFREIGRPPRAPIKWVLLSNQDVYSGGANFVFSSTWQWGTVISYKRYEAGATSTSVVAHRAAKQVLGTVIKSFGLEPSPDPGCVTSYSASLPEFDAKGNRPNRETLAEFERRVAAIDAAWARDRAQRAGLR